MEGVTSKVGYHGPPHGEGRLISFKRNQRSAKIEYYAREGRPSRGSSTALYIYGRAEFFRVPLPCGGGREKTFTRE